MSLHQPVAPPRTRSRVASGQGSRTMSANVRRLHESLTTLLNDHDKAYFVHALNDYNSKRNVYGLVQHLRSILNTPEKKQLFVLLGKVIPSSDQALFWKHVETLCTGPNITRPESVISNVSSISNNVSMVSQSRPESRLYEQNNRTSNRNSSLLQQQVHVKHPPNIHQNHQTSFQQQNQSYNDQNYAQIPPQSQSHHHSMSNGEELHGKTVRKTVGVPPSVDQNNDLKRIVLKKTDQEGGGLGFSIRGGAEHSVGIFVSMVEPYSLAEKRGLRKGDQIMQVNDLPFEKISHSDAVKVRHTFYLEILFIRHTSVHNNLLSNNIHV